MVKKYTISASFPTSSGLKLALRKLKRIGVEPRDIDTVSQVGDKKKSAKILKSHKGYQCLSLGFALGGLLGGFLRIFIGLDEGVSLLQTLSIGFLMEIGRSVTQAAFLGALVGYFIGRGMVQYNLSYREGEKEEALHHLAMVNVGFEQREKVVETLESVAQEVNVVDNNKEIELGLQARE